MNSSEDQLRAEFERWVSSPPFERPITKRGSESAWPDNYRHEDVQLAWCSWVDSRRAAKPKRLRWVPCEGDGQVYVADTEFFWQYRCEDYGDAFIASLWLESSRMIRLETPEAPRGLFPSMEAAKAAAQADYDKRALACFEEAGHE